MKYISYCLNVVFVFDSRCRQRLSLSLCVWLIFLVVVWLLVGDGLRDLGEPLRAAAVAGHVVPDPVRPDLAGQQRLRRTRAEHPALCGTLSPRRRTVQGRRRTV